MSGSLKPVNRNCINYSRTIGKERKGLYFLFRKVMGLQEQVSVMGKVFAGAGDSCSADDAREAGGIK